MPNLGLLPAPAYDSGWQAIQKSGTLVLTHNLKTSPQSMMVDLVFGASKSLGSGINNQFYGTSAFGAPPNISGYLGAYWDGLTSTKINVFREAQDNSAQRVRVRIWVHG